MPTPVVSSVDSPFRVREIATSIHEAVKVPEASSPVAAFQTLSAHGYDQAPVTRGDRVVGWVRTEHLRDAKKIKSVTTRLDQCALVAETAPLAIGLHAMGEREFVFTVGDSGVTGFATTSDLDRHPVRSHFYLLLAAVEMLLAQIVDLTALHEDVIARIKANGDSAERWRSAREARLDLKPVEYLYLRDLAELFSESRAATSSVWTPRMQSHLTRLCQLRARVMHPTRPLLGKSKAAELAASARGAENVVRALQEVVKSL